jgi:hypothetical protein
LIEFIRLMARVDRGVTLGSGMLGKQPDPIAATRIGAADLAICRRLISLAAFRISRRKDAAVDRAGFSNQLVLRFWNQSNYFAHIRFDL